MTVSVQDANVGEEFEDQDWRQRGQRLIRITGIYVNPRKVFAAGAPRVYTYTTTAHRKPRMIGRVGRIRQRTLESRKWRKISH